MKRTREREPAASRHHARSHQARILGEALEENLQADAEHIRESRERIAKGERHLSEMREQMARSARAIKHSREVLTDKT